MPRTHYEVLEIPENADHDAIRKAYRNAILNVHPDLNENDPNASKRAAEINAALHILTDPDRRRKYNEKLQTNRSAKAPNTPGNSQNKSSESDKSNATNSAPDTGTCAPGHSSHRQDQFSMDFDGYYKWLGIPPKDQPPNHYRLLAIELFESDADVIDAAADQRMTHLRSYIVGKNNHIAEKLLNEVSQARICLLDPRKKGEYDVALRQQIQTAVIQPRPAAPVFAAIVGVAVGIAFVGLMAMIFYFSSLGGNTPSKKEEVVYIPPQQVSDKEPITQVQETIPKKDSPADKKQDDPPEQKVTIKPQPPVPHPPVPEPSPPPSTTPNPVDLDEELQRLTQLYESARTEPEYQEVAQQALSIIDKVDEPDFKVASRILELGLLAARKSKATETVKKITLRIIELNSEEQQ